MKKKQLEIGDLVQLNPEHKFGEAVLVVTEPKCYGCMGYLLSPVDINGVSKFDGLTRFNEIAYLLARFEEFEYVGKVHWMHKHKDEQVSSWV